jgi:hypothetical protein
MTGFEPAASSSRTKRATGLRYIPNKQFKFKKSATEIYLACRVFVNNHPPYMIKCFNFAFLNMGIGQTLAFGYTDD